MAFLTYSWLALAAAMTGTSFFPLVVTRGGADLGVAPLMVRRRAVVNLVNWVPFPYVGPLVPADLLGACLDALRYSDLQHGVIRQQQSFPPAAAVDVQALTDRGFSVQQDPTYIVDTQLSEEQLWAALESRCRTKIRKAEREGVQIQDAVDGSTLHAVMQAAFGARDLRSGYEGLFPPSADSLAALDLSVRHVVAIREGRVLGSLVSFARHDAALIWQGGILPEFRSTHANVLLYWDAIKWAHRIGAGFIDLVGIPDEGIGRFKSQFGGAVRHHTVARRGSALSTMIEGRAGGWFRARCHATRQLQLLRRMRNRTRPAAQ